MTDTKAERQPPSEPPNVAVGFAGDEIEDLAYVGEATSEKKANLLADAKRKELAP